MFLTRDNVGEIEIRLLRGSEPGWIATCPSKGQIAGLVSSERFLKAGESKDLLFEGLGGPILHSTSASGGASGNERCTLTLWATAGAGQHAPSYPVSRLFLCVR